MAVAAAKATVMVLVVVADAEAGEATVARSEVMAWLAVRVVEVVGMMAVVAGEVEVKAEVAAGTERAFSEQAPRRARRHAVAHRPVAVSFPRFVEHDLVR